MLQEVHLQHVEGAVDVGGLPENQRPQATRKLHAAMASCWERRGGGSFKRQAELEKAFTEKARQCVPAPRALATRKNRGTATRPASRMCCSHLACVNYSFILLSPLSFSLSFFLHLTITFFIYAMVFCLIGLGSFFVRSFMSLFLYASIRWFFLASCISFARFLFVIICLSVLNYFFDLVLSPALSDKVYRKIA